MAEKRGLLIDLEGIDGSGTSTQLYMLAEHIEHLDKYQDILKTHEPWKNEEIKKKLKTDMDAYSDPLEMTELYVDDRAKHTHRLIRPNLKAGVVVITDRYSMSTLAYQWTQGVDLADLIQLHKERGILIPDLTFFVDVPRKVATRRLEKSGRASEKFERDPKFVDELISAYNALMYTSKVQPGILGKVVRINGNQRKEKVSEDIAGVFDHLYTEWRSGNYPKIKSHILI